MDKKHFIDLIDDIIDEYELDWGNGEVDIDFETETGYLTVEAPGHAVVGVFLNPIVAYVVKQKNKNNSDTDEFISGHIKKAIAEHIEDFSADDEFNEIGYEVTSNPNNHFTPSEFFRTLQDSEEFFTETARKLRQDAYGIADFEDED